MAPHQASAGTRRRLSRAAVVDSDDWPYSGSSTHTLEESAHEFHEGWHRRFSEDARRLQEERGQHRPDGSLPRQLAPIVDLGGPGQESLRGRLELDSQAEPAQTQAGAYGSERRARESAGVDGEVRDDRLQGLNAVPA